MIKGLENGKSLILFDGVCNLCDTSIQYVIKHDKHDRFRFAALQSDLGKRILEKFSVDVAEIDSIILYSKDNGLSYKSTAALKIASHLSFPINLMSGFLIVPSFLRNGIYGYIAKNRYKWFGKKDQCMVPTSQLRAKFLG